MRKSIGLMAVVILIVSGLVWGSAVAEEEEMCVPMGDITLEALSPQPQRESVDFPHNEHFQFDCGRCHHTWDHQSSIQNCTAAGCHYLAEAPRTDNGRLIEDPQIQIRYFKNAYHQMCIGCHKEIKQKNMAQEASKLALGEKLQPVGPTGCIDCHPED